MENKKYYTVELECLVPAVIKARVLVPEEDWEKAAIEAIKTGQFMLKKANMKKKSIKILDSGWIKYTKAY